MPEWSDWLSYFPERLVVAERTFARSTNPLPNRDRDIMVIHYREIGPVDPWALEPQASTAISRLELVAAINLAGIGATKLHQVREGLVEAIAMSEAEPPEARQARIVATLKAFNRRLDEGSPTDGR